MDTLKPVEVSEYYINRVASGMSRYFWDNIFKGIFDILKNNSVENSKDDVINALKSGRIWYENGAFRTKTRFSSKVSATLEAMGAKFQYNAYYIAESLIPFEYVQVIAFVNAQNLAKANRILEHLGGLAAVLANISLENYIEVAVELMFKKLQLDIVKSAQEAKIPVIELGIVQPSINFPKTKKERLQKGKKQLELNLLPPKDDTGEDENPPKDDEGGTTPPKDKNKPKEEPKKEEPKTQGYSLEEIDQYWKEKDKEQDKLHDIWKDSYDKLRKAKKDKNLSNKEFKDLEKEVEKNSKNLADFQKDKYQNAPQLDFTIDDIALDAKSKKIAQDYTYNMQYWVKKWEAKNIIEMRKDVLKMVQQGARYERIQEYFEKRWKIAKNKAAFLAKNESDLAGSVIKATDYQELGCPGYVWGRSSAREKRELHKQYYGKFFTWEDKPIIDEKLGIRGYPRQIWNCSCHMLIKPPTMSDIIQKHTEVRNAKRNIFTKIKYAITNGKQCNNNAWRYRRFGEGQTF